MVIKWGDLYYLQKTAGFLLFAAFVVVPSLAFGDTIVTSKTYVDSKITQTVGTATTTAPSENAVKNAVDAKQAKPSSVANGKVLTYTGNDATTYVSADYVKVPNSDPSSTTPSAFSYIWVQ